MNAYSIQSSFNKLVSDNLPDIGGVTVSKDDVAYATPDVAKDIDSFRISLQYEAAQSPYELMGQDIGFDDMGDVVEGAPYMVACLIAGWASNTKDTWYTELLEYENWLRYLVGTNKTVDVNDYTTKPRTAHANLPEWQKPFATIELSQPVERAFRLPPGVDPKLQAKQFLVTVEGYELYGTANNP